jgi:hypothetical protein
MKTKLYILIAFISIVVMLLTTIGILVYSNKSLKNDYANAMNNLNAYQLENSKLSGANRVYKMTISELEYSQDTMFRAMDSIRKELKIKDKNLNQIQYIKYEVRVTDTLELVDTIFIKPSFYMDTTLSDKWHSTRIMMKYPSYIMVEPSLESDKYVVFSFKKETVKPPRKFFLFRWFQKKQKVVNVDVVETNPYVINKAQRFMEVVK